MLVKVILNGLDQIASALTPKNEASVTCCLDYGLVHIAKRPSGLPHDLTTQFNLGSNISSILLRVRWPVRQ